MYWTQRASLPPGSGSPKSASLVKWGNLLIVIGGVSPLTGLPTNHVNAYDPNDDIWFPLHSLNYASEGGGAGAVLIGNTAYWVDQLNQELRSIELTSGDEDSFPPPASPDPGNDTVSLIAHGDKIYWMGFIPQVFDTNLETWDTLPSPPEMFLGQTAVLDPGNDIIYVHYFDPSEVAMALVAYDLINETWSVLNGDSELRFGGGGLLDDVGGAILFAGGGDPLSDPPELSRSISLYTIDSGIWLPSVITTPDPFSGSGAFWLEWFTIGEQQALIIPIITLAGWESAIYAFTEHPLEEDYEGEWETDYPSPPVQHGDLDYSTTGQWGDLLVLLGGYDSSAVSVFDPNTNSWTALPAAGGDIAGMHLRAVTIGDDIYWIDTDEDNLRRLNLTTGQEDFYPPPGSDFGIGHLEVLDGLIYHLPSMEVFDPNVGTWASITAPNIMSYSFNTAADPVGKRLYLHAFDENTNAMWLGAYDPDTDSWQELTGNTIPVSGASGVAHDNTIIFAGGWGDPNHENSAAAVHVYHIDTDSWSEMTPLPLNSNQEAGQVSMVLPVGEAVRLFVFLADFSHYTGRLVSFPLEAGSGPNIVEEFLDIEVHVALEINTSDAYLAIEVDVPAVSNVITSELLITFTTGSALVEGNALVVVDVPATTSQAPWTPPATEVPEGANPPFLPRDPDEVSEAPAMGLSLLGGDEYAFQWNVRGQLSGSVTSLGGDSDPHPEESFIVEGDPDITIEWGAGPPTTRTHSWGQVTADKATTFKLPELVPFADGESSSGGSMALGNCLRPHGASLCDGFDPILTCLAKEMRDELMPTRLQLAQQAADAAGLALIILHGLSGLPQPHEPIDSEYRTLGKSPMQVITDMLLAGGAMYWFAPGVILINGGGVPPGALLARPELRGEGGSVSTLNAEEFNDEEPQLEDFTGNCRESSSGDDPCAGETFETAFSGTFRWTESGGDPGRRTETETTLTKQQGRLVREEIVTSREVWIKHSRMTSPFPSPFDRYAFRPVEWVTREHTYLACCPQALAHTTEQVWTRRLMYDADPDLEDYQSSSDTILSSFKDVRQIWHAEGWLRSRIETTYTHHGWVVGSAPPGTVPAGDRVRVMPTYKRSHRVETYIPVGNGLWHIETRITDSIQMPVNEDITPEAVGVHWGQVVNSYTIVTDQAPPQVSCGDDPCAGPCEEEAEKNYDRAHAAWEAKRSAWELNHPDRVVTNISYAGRVMSFLPGDITPAGIVTNVSWRGSGPRMGTPSESTEVEFVGVRA